MSAGVLAEASPATTPRQAAPAAALERFIYDDAIVRKFLCATMVWGLVA